MLSTLLSPLMWLAPGTRQAAAHEAPHTLQGTILLVLVSEVEAITDKFAPRRSRELNLKVTGYAR